MEPPGERPPSEYGLKPAERDPLEGFVLIGKESGVAELVIGPWGDPGNLGFNAVERTAEDLPPQAGGGRGGGAGEKEILGSGERWAKVAAMLAPMSPPLTPA